MWAERHNPHVHRIFWDTFFPEDEAVPVSKFHETLYAVDPDNTPSAASTFADSFGDSIGPESAETIFDSYNLLNRGNRSRYLAVGCNAILGVQTINCMEGVVKYIGHRDLNFDDFMEHEQLVVDFRQYH